MALNEKNLGANPEKEVKRFANSFLFIKREQTQFTVKED